MLKGVLFDFDGTLADTLPLCVDSFKFALDTNGSREFSVEEIMATFGRSEEGTFRILLPEMEEACMVAFLNYYRTNHSKYAMFAGAREMLSELADLGVSLALVTGKGAQSASVTFEEFDLGGIFEYVETGIPEGLRKTEQIAQILKDWGFDPSETVYVGDTVTDVLASQANHVPVAAVTFASLVDIPELVAAKPDAVLNTFEELRSWLLNRIR